MHSDRVVVILLVNVDGEGRYEMSFKPSKFQKAIFKFIASNDGSAIVEAVAGCLSGDTEIRLHRTGRGFGMPLEKAYLRFNNLDNHPKNNWDSTKPTFVRSFNGKTIRLHSIQDVVESGVKEVFKMTLTNGLSIKATFKHKFMTKNGFIKLKNLELGMHEIMCDVLHATSTGSAAPKRHDPMIRGLIYHPYGATDARGVAKRIAEHTAIYEANMNKITLDEYIDILKTSSNKSKSLKFVDSSKYDIHHKDFDHTNNSIGNLEIMLRNVHKKLHANYGNFNQGIPKYCKIKSIEPIGEEMTYDIICHDPHRNFVANGMVVHNSGKTTTIVQALKKIPPSLRTVFLAFNKSIAEEIKRRVPPNVKVQTLNGLGHGAWMRFIDGNVTLNINKTRDILFNNQGLKDTHTEFALRKIQTPVRRLVSIAKSIGLVPENCTEAAGLVPDTAETWERIIDHFDIQFGTTSVGGDMVSDKPQAIAVAREILTIGLDMWNEIDFDDQMYMTVVFNVPMSKYDIVFVDEAQDVSDIQRAMLTMCRRKTGRVIAVGDPCQPPKTIVETTEGSKPIYKIRKGDMVISGDVAHSTFRLSGRKVTGVTKKEYFGSLITIHTKQWKSLSSSYTENHHCIANFKPLAGKYCVYVMRKTIGDTDQFRIGQCKFAYSQGIGVRSRMVSEGANAAWILSVHGTKREALIQEAILSHEHHLPTITFKPVNGGSQLTKKALDEIWKGIGCNVISAENCLFIFGKNLHYPIYEAETKWKVAAKRPCVVRACNLLEGALVLTFNNKSHYAKKNWVPIKKIELEKHAGFVYSMTVEDDHTYVGDGILTHNCQAIYGFRGADSESLANIAKTFNAISLPLSISYRCPKKIVLEAQKYVSHIESHESAPEGEVEDYGTYAPAMFKSNDMVVCRNTAPLIKLAYKLISAKIPATIMGRDIGKGLVTLINKLKAKGIESLISKLNEWRAKETQRALGKDPEADLSKIEDKYDIIMMFINHAGADTIPSLITAIENLFGDKAIDAVVLSTIHRAKGMEADRVFILDGWLMPSKYARKPWQMIQENNLTYVAITRAKKSLFYVTSPKDQKDE